MNRWTLSAICLLAILSLSACGGGDANAPVVNAPTATNSGGGGCAPANTADDTPKEDPNKWKKVAIPKPGDWEKLAKDGQAELRNSKYKILLKPKSSYTLLSSHADKAVPHASSGTDAEWEEWRNTVSAVFVYNATKTKDDPAEALKKHGGEFIEGFDATAVGTVSGFAVYKHPDAQEKWLACVSNENGTYILVALVRNGDAENLMKPYPGMIEAE